jgi:quercetin dioxygenase-like cupin family protein
MKIGFRGTRHGMTELQKEALREVLAEYHPDEFHHGDYVGADAEAHEIVRVAYPSTRIVIHPPTKQTLRAFSQGEELRPARGYIARNRDLVKTCDMLVAAPKSMQEQHGGTWSVIRYARIWGRTTVLLNPEADGAWVELVGDKAASAHEKGNVLVRSTVLEPGESSSWHTDSCHRITVVLSGDRLAIEFRESGQIRQVDVQAGQVDWDKPTTEVHRAINVGCARYEEVVVFFLSEPGQDPQPKAI